jgi:hypothetical protein
MTEYFIFLSACIGLTLRSSACGCGWINNAGAGEA